MRANRKTALSIVVLAFVAATTMPAALGANQYNVTFTIRPNGDVAVDMKFTLPMAEYMQMRSTVLVPQLLLRDLGSERSDIEVKDTDAKYDDDERSVNFTMLALGGARNMGDHWEFEVDKGRVFSNLNEPEKTMYFTPSIEGEMGSFQGQEKVVFPDEATQIEWDKSKRVVTYVLPVPPSPCSSGKTVLWVLSAACILAGAAMLVVSFVRAPAAAEPKKKE